MKKYYKILLTLLTIAFIVLLILVKLNKTMTFDLNVYKFIMNIEQPVITRIVKIITDFGDTFWIVLIIISCFIFFKNKKYPKLITLNILGVVFLNQLLKHLVMRPRPEFLSMIKEVGFSFPSGHSMASFGFYGYFIYLTNISNINKKIKILLTIFLSILIILIGLSRIYLGVHYFSDVISGFIVSAIYLILFIIFTKKYLKNE